jgi:hypothetical protein
MTAKLVQHETDGEALRQEGDLLKSSCAPLDSYLKDL